MLIYHQMGQTRVGGRGGGGRGRGEVVGGGGGGRGEGEVVGGGGWRGFVITTTKEIL